MKVVIVFVLSVFLIQVFLFWAGYKFGMRFGVEQGKADVLSRFVVPEDSCYAKGGKGC